MYMTLLSSSIEETLSGSANLLKAMKKVPPSLVDRAVVTVSPPAAA